MPRHTLSVLVENRPAVLARTAGLFARRGFNIHSLAVGPTEHPEVSRMTVVADVDGHVLEQVTKQLNKLINVLKVVELEMPTTVQRELLLVKVKADASTRGQILDLVHMFQAEVVDVSPDSLVIEASATSERNEALLKVLEPFGIRELVQSGMVALGRGPKALMERKL